MITSVVPSKMSSPWVAPLTIAAVKQTIIELGKPDAGQDLELCRELVETCFSSEDYQEGRLAFMEKRKPRFQGR